MKRMCSLLAVFAMTCWLPAASGCGQSATGPQAPEKFQARPAEIPKFGSGPSLGGTRETGKKNKK